MREIKRVAERLDIGFQLQPPDLEAGETIASVTAAVVPAAGLTLDGVAQKSDDTVFQWVKEGVAGVEYNVTFTITISSGRILTPVYIVEVI